MEKLFEGCARARVIRLLSVAMKNLEYSTSLACANISKALFCFMYGRLNLTIAKIFFAFLLVKIIKSGDQRMG